LKRPRKCHQMKTLQTQTAWPGHRMCNISHSRTCTVAFRLYIVHHGDGAQPLLSNTSLLGSASLA
jgi:hypothetical protein